MTGIVTRIGSAILPRLRRLDREEAAQLTLEWAIVLAFFAFPMYFTFKECFKLLIAHFQMVTFMETVPFP